MECRYVKFEETISKLMPEMNIWSTETDKASVHWCENITSSAPYTATKDSYTFSR